MSDFLEGLPLRLDQLCAWPAVSMPVGSVFRSFVSALTLRVGYTGSYSSTCRNGRQLSVFFSAPKVLPGTGNVVQRYRKAPFPL